MQETRGRSDRLTRRGMLLGGLAAVATACTADPRIGLGAGSNSPRPTSSPASPTTAPVPIPTFAGAAIGATAEADLAARIDGLVHQWRDEVSPETENLLDGLRDAHRTHAAALAAAEPTARPTVTTTPAARQKPAADRLDGALSDLVRREVATAAEHRERALAATGFGALLWASMAVAASSFAAALPEADGDDPPAFARTPQRRNLPTVSDTDAIRDLVAQLHAVIYGYQLAIGGLTTRTTRDRAVARLRQHRQLRDSLIATLTTRKAEVPAAAPAYAPSVRPTTPARAAQLIRSMERRLLPFVGLWMASAPQWTDRAQAYAALAATDAAARAWGAGLLVWPGWNG